MQKDLLLYAERAKEKKLLEHVREIYKHRFDEKHGGFGTAPKFSEWESLLFLMNDFEISKEDGIMQMVNTSLLQMYRGALFDHIGGGFYSCSKDASFLEPQFRKTLADNAGFLMVYSRAYEITKNLLYLGVAEKTAAYVIQELASPSGGFYSAQEAESEEKAKSYYLWEMKEIYRLLGHKNGTAFCRYFDIREQGKNIPNLLKNSHITANYNAFLPKLYEYRKRRGTVHREEQIQMADNGLMIAAMCCLYRVTGKELYLETAKRAQSFLEHHLYQQDILFGSWQEGICLEKGSAQDYAGEIFALLALYEATLEPAYFEKAWKWMKAAVSAVQILKNENLMMAYNWLHLRYLTEKTTLSVKNDILESMQPYQSAIEAQIDFLMQKAQTSPMKYAMFLTALLEMLCLENKIEV